MKVTPADNLVLDFRQRAEAVRREATSPAAAITPVRPVQAIDPYDAADVEFDFEAAERAAQATLLRDRQQQILAEMADARSKGSVSVQAAIAAYREFEA